MPLLKFHILRGRSEAEINALLDAAHEAMLEAFRVPERDRYQIVFEHDADMFRAQDRTGLSVHGEVRAAGSGLPPSRERI